MNLRYMDLGEVSDIDLVSWVEMPLHINYDEYTMVAYAHPYKTIFITNFDDIEEDRILDYTKVPNDFTIRRVVNSKTGGFLLFDRFSKNQFILLYEPTAISSTDQRSFMNILARMFRKEYNLATFPSGWRRDSNDLSVEVDGKVKKFMSTARRYDEKSMDHALFIIESPPYDLLDQISKFDSDKIKRKGGITSLKDVVIGLDEIIPNLNNDKLKLQIRDAIAKHYNLGIKEDIPNKEELEVIKKITPIINSENWILYAKRDDLKI